MSMATKNEFAVFILTHGRADNVVTYRTLERQGYTGDVYIVVDNEDATIDRYRENFGDKVVVFDKLAIARTFDEGNNGDDRRSVTYARNASFDIARDLGLTYFLQLDDDYRSFVWKFSESLRYKERPVKNLDRLFGAMLDYYKSVDAVTIALAQNGDFIGGQFSHLAKTVNMKRKSMNSFFCSVDRPFTFVGLMNEDVNTYTTRGNKGDLFLTVCNAAVIQTPTQSSEGGITELYLKQGTYQKSFYTVMYAPFCTTVGEIGYLFRRMHHRIKWENAVPKIVDQKYCKRLGA